MPYIYIVFIFFALVFDRLNIFLFMLVNSLCHEAGHILMCRILKCTPKVTVSLFGAKLSGYPENRYKKLLILLAGPAVNLLFVIVSQCILSYSFSLDMYIFSCVNAIIFLFNMLPVSFLDGGQIIGIFFDNHIFQKIMDTMSFIIITAAVSAFSANIFHSAVAVMIFGLYYLINRVK